MQWSHVTSNGANRHSEALFKFKRFTTFPRRLLCKSATACLSGAETLAGNKKYQWKQRNGPLHQIACMQECYLQPKVHFFTSKRCGANAEPYPVLCHQEQFQNKGCSEARVALSTRVENRSW